VTGKVAAGAWSSSAHSASRRLASLARSGWLRRVRRGTYQIVPLEGTSTIAAPYEDPWTLAATLFEPCYVGGWSAAEHWGLTEQLFRDTFVVTSAHVRATHISAAGLEFRLARVAPKRSAGDAYVWRGATRVACSSPQRTIVDGANAPAWVGGVRHLGEMLARYVETPKRDIDTLRRAVDLYARGAGAKRLGYLAEQLSMSEQNAETRNSLHAIREVAREHKTTGIVKLDPAIRSRGRMNTAWGLWINAHVARSDSA
jgi:predicted transcriptional regulator of viral defense system